MIRNFALTGCGLLLWLAAAGCSGKPMSSSQLLAMNLFPEEVPGRWRLSTRPKRSPVLDGGYVWATYNPQNRQTDGYGTLALWIVDKGNSRDAEAWLARLLDGTHTSDTIVPLRLDLSEVETIREIRQEISGCPVTIKGGRGFERVERRQFGNLNYRHYHTDGRFVIGVEYLSTLRDAEEIRRRIWPLLEHLRLPG